MPKRWVVGGFWAGLMSAGMLTCIGNTAAEQLKKAEKIIISEVIITGNQRVTTEEIKTHLRTQPNKEYNPAVVDEDVRALYKTGQFSNITSWLNPDGVDRAKIYLGIREIPNTVQKVTYLGAKHIKQDELQNRPAEYAAQPQSESPGLPKNSGALCRDGAIVRRVPTDQGRRPG